MLHGKPVDMIMFLVILCNLITDCFYHSRIDASRSAVCQAGDKGTTGCIRVAGAAHFAAHAPSVQSERSISALMPPIRIVGAIQLFLEGTQIIIRDHSLPDLEHRFQPYLLRYLRSSSQHDESPSLLLPQITVQFAVALFEEFAPGIIGLQTDCVLFPSRHDG